MESRTSSKHGKNVLILRFYERFLKGRKQHLTLRVLTNYKSFEPRDPEVPNL